MFAAYHGINKMNSNMQTKLAVFNTLHEQSKNVETTAQFACCSEDHKAVIRNTNITETLRLLLHR